MTHFEIFVDDSSPLITYNQDSDILRVCVDDKRSTLIDRAKGKMSPGLYMRDIAEVREGFDSFDFKKNTNAPTDPDLCLSLIGSERTISLELPGKVCMSVKIDLVKSWTVKS